MSNAPVKVVQSLARHSTPTLTLGTYVHVGLYDQTSALDALPDQSQPDPAPEAATLPATGTHGPISKRLALHFPYGGDGTRRNLSVSVANDDLKAEPQPAMPMDRNPLETSDLDAPCQGLTLPGGTEGVGFEPTDGEPSTVFKTVPIDHSGTPPRFGQREAPGQAYWPTSSMMSSATKIGTSTVTATAMASLGRESTSISSPSWRIRSLA